VTERPTPRLWPHERWIVNIVLSRQEQASRNPANKRLHETYGEVGFSLLVAATCGTFGAGVVMVLGVIVLFASGPLGTSERAGYWVIALGYMLQILPVVRMVQTSRAGRAYRSRTSRPH